MHPDDMGADNIYRKFADAKLPRQGWKDRYCSADRCRKLPVQLAPEGTDFMPVRCLVVRTKSSSGDFDTRVLLGADGWVITGESNQAVIEIAAAHGLNMSRRLFRPAASGRHRA
ncbi:hypothetical protein GCM10007918_00720 [Piscinibacter gummiphilus]|nr:hypothetical protein GCM10007918_00720 [Piscinibacter gummiphilus]